MLVLTRRVGERIIIFNELDPEPFVITPMPGNGKGNNFGTQVRLQFEANRRYVIHREEIYKRILKDGNI